MAHESLRPSKDRALAWPTSASGGIQRGNERRRTCQITGAAAETGANALKTERAAWIIAIVLKMATGEELWHLSVV